MRMWMPATAPASGQSIDPLSDCGTVAQKKARYPQRCRSLQAGRFHLAVSAHLQPRRFCMGSPFLRRSSYGLPSFIAAPASEAADPCTACKNGTRKCHRRGSRPRTDSTVGIMGGHWHRVLVADNRILETSPYGATVAKSPLWPLRACFLPLKHLLEFPKTKGRINHDDGKRRAVRRVSFG